MSWQSHGFSGFGRQYLSARPGKFYPGEFYKEALFGARKSGPTAALTGILLLWLTFCTLAANAQKAVEATALPSSLPSSLAGAWHLEYTAFKKVRIRYTIHCEHPAGMITEWEVIAGVPPELPQQKVHASHISIYNQRVPNAVSQTLDDTRQNVYWLVCPVQSLGQDTQLEATVEHEITYFKRSLKSGSSLRSVANLSTAEQRLCLQETEGINYNAPEFREFLRSNDLRRHSGEAILDFGRRVHHFVRTYMRYNGSARFDDTTIAADCQTRDGHCGNYSRLVVGIMRASNVPARILFGHWFDGDVTLSEGQNHTQAEFFAPGVGWVLSDSSTSVPKGGWTPGWNLEEGFANDTLGFATFNLHGPLLLPTRNFGTQKQQHLQNIYTPMRGGDWNKIKMTYSFQVITLPMNEQKAGEADQHR